MAGPDPYGGSFDSAVPWLQDGRRPTLVGPGDGSSRLGEGRVHSTWFPNYARRVIHPGHEMPLLLLVLVAVSAGLGSGLAAWRYPRLSAGSSAPAFEAARKVGESAAAHSRFRRTLVSRLDASAATGLALTLALLLTIVGGLGLGALAYLERTNGHLNRIDRSVAAWGNDHATAFSTHGLDLVTQLGAITGVLLVLAVVLAAAETIRTRSAWIVPFLLVLLAGEEILMNAVKILADRARPTFNPAAAGLGPSFPSGHSATAAAFYAGAALLLSRRRGHVARACSRASRSASQSPSP